VPEQHITFPRRKVLRLRTVLPDLLLDRRLVALDLLDRRILDFVHRHRRDACDAQNGG
jgi:hypothetical protein